MFEAFTNNKKYGGKIENILSENKKYIINNLKDLETIKEVSLKYNEALEELNEMRKKIRELEISGLSKDIEIGDLRYKIKKTNPLLLTDSLRID